MKKPNIIALPTSQMAAFCDLLGVPKDKQMSLQDMVTELEKADFTGLKVIFKVDKVSDAIVKDRKARLGRT